MKTTILVIVLLASTGTGRAAAAAATPSDSAAPSTSAAPSAAALPTGTAWGDVEGRGGPNDPHYAARGSWGQNLPDQWGLRALRVYTDVVPATAQSSEPVVVAVIDTGLDYTHEDFAGDRLWRNPQEERNGRDDDGNGYRDDLIGWDFVDGDNNPWDDSGHGTHLAGIIGACTDNALGIAGVDPGARIMPLKVANFTGQAKSSAVAAAIHYAVDHGARVINLSLGGELVTDLERDAARRAADEGVLIVVAAGNKGLDTARFGYPSLPGVLVVGASAPQDVRAGFSNFGTHLDVLAPGVDILSLRARDTDFIALSSPPDYPPGGAFVGEDHRYYRASGSSFAAALVSGMASRILAAHPEYSGDAVARVIKASAIDLEAPGVDQPTGHGRVDLVRALGADPGSFVAARLSGVSLSLEDRKVWLAFRGSAAGESFAGAHLEVRPAPGALPETAGGDDRRMSRRERREAAERLEALAEWQPLGEPIASPTENGTLARTDLDTLMTSTGGATDWEVRLIVTTHDGKTHESHLRMALPVPGAPQTASVAGEEAADG